MPRSHLPILFGPKIIKSTLEDLTVILVLIDDFSSPGTKCQVRYCEGAVSGVRRRELCVVVRCHAS